MAVYPPDIYAEPANLGMDTLAGLGPLAPLACVWAGMKGVDIVPKPESPRTRSFHERIELQPVDPGNNGPQLLFALRHHTRMTQPGEIGTYHDQAGYWLWELATATVMAIKGQAEPFHHRDSNRLTRVMAPQPNPLAR